MVKKDLIIETGLNLIPYVGGSLAHIYSDNKNNKRFERIEEFYKNIKQQMDGLEDDLLNRINIENHDSELLTNLIERQHEVIETEYIGRKKQFIQSYFINNLIMETSERNYDKKHMFLDALKNLNYSELELISLLKLKGHAVSIKDIRFNNNPSEESYTIIAHINRIRNYGFIEMYTSNMTIGGEIDNIHGNIVKVSPFGNEFFNFCLA